MKFSWVNTRVQKPRKAVTTGRTQITLTRPPKVVLHAQKNGSVRVYFDEDVQVYWVDDRAPEDRAYKMAQLDVPEKTIVGRLMFIFRIYEGNDEILIYGIVTSM